MVEAAIERLNRNPMLLATLTAVPYVGGSITQVLTWFGQEIVQERNKRLFQQLSEHLEAIDEQAIKKDYFETPEGFDLLIKALDESRRTRSEEKRDLIARILAGAASTNSEQGEYSPEEYLSIVATLTVKELAVARTMYRLQKNQNYRLWEYGNKWRPWLSHRSEILRELALDSDDLTLILDRIAATGLIELVLINFPKSPGQSYWRGPTSDKPKSPGRSYWVAPTFDKLMKYLRLEV